MASSVKVGKHITKLMKMYNAAYLSLGLGCLFFPTLQAQVILIENFDYSDGALTTVGAPAWTHGSTTEHPIQVSGGQVVGLTSGSGSREDATRLFDASHDTGTLYAGLDLMVTATPIGSGDYCFHFRSSNNAHRGRLFIEAPELTGFRLGLENDGSPASVLSEDLALNVSYRVVLAYNIENGTSAVWLNSSTVASPTLADPTAPGSFPAINGIGLRQGSVGSVTGVNVDHLVVSTDFQTAVPEPATYATLTGVLLLGYGVYRRARAGRRFIGRTPCQQRP